MLRILSKLKPLPFCASFSLFRKDFDIPIAQNALHKDEEMTGWDRVRSIFYVDEFNNISHEMNYIYQSTACSVLAGVVYGGITNSRAAYIKFMENNQATAFDNTFEAKKMLQDKVTIALGKGAWKWGWRLALFTFTFTSFTTILSTYRGDSSVLDYSLAGFVTGTLYRLNTGLQGSLVGGILGTILATIGGVVIVGLLQISGTSMEDVRYWQYKYRESRQKYHNMGLENAAKEKNKPLEKAHDILAKKENVQDSLENVK